MGALSKFTRSRFGVDVRWHPEPITTTVGTTATQLWRANADRLEVVFMNLSAYVMYLFTDASVSSSKGFFLGASGGSVVLSAEDDGELVGMPWWAVATTSGTIFSAEIEGI